jgi:hypothetical protein
MTNRIVHPREQFTIDLRAVTANNACYATTYDSSILESRSRECYGTHLLAALAAIYLANMTFQSCGLNISGRL